MNPWIVTGLAAVGAVVFVRWRARIGAARFVAAQPGPTDPSFVDAYLIRWDRFAQGDNRLVPYIRRNKAAFEEALSLLVREKPAEGAVRAAFYTLVQVGGYIERASRPTFSLLEEWLSRDFAQTVAIPMYKRVLEEGDASP